MKSVNILDKNNLPQPIIPKNKNYINISGEKIGRLTVLYPCGYLEKDNRLAWLCKCECGNYIQVTGKRLRANGCKSCGCLQRDEAIKSNIKRGKPIEPGMKFGKLTVIKFNGYKPKNGKNASVYTCKCDCGVTKEIFGVYLNCGDTCSCGCLNSKGEMMIANFLQQRGIPFNTQVTYTGCVSQQGNLLKFDFQINDFLIEYQGSIHYSYREAGWNSKEEFLKRKERDKIKKDYCSQNNIKLYEIIYQDNCIDKLIEILEKEGIKYEL